VTVAVIGIDPGVNGALALLVDGELLEVLDMPTFKIIKNGKNSQLVNSYELSSILMAWEDAHHPEVILELIGSMPKQGVATMFSMGRNYGTVEGVVCALGLPLSHVRPNQWKKDAGLLKQPKDASRLKAMSLWPKHTAEFRLAKHDGRAEAALIARYGSVTPPGQDEPNDR
jgi:crossover junction endodeoxyribonuclease RuvC